MKNLSWVGLGHFVMNQLGHLHNQLLVVVLVVKTLFKQFEIQLSSLIVNAECTHLCNTVLIHNALLSLQLHLFLSLHLLFSDFFECRKHFFIFNHHAWQFDSALLS